MASADVRHSPAHTVPCPCGMSERFFTAEDGAMLGLHRTTISDAEPHFHREMTETYYVLSGGGAIWLDGVCYPVAEGTSILIRPGVVHRGEGEYQVIVVYTHPELHETDTHHPES